MQKRDNKGARRVVSEPPSSRVLPLIHANEAVQGWLDHYWAKLNLPPAERQRLALTQDRREFARWTGRRLNPLALGCYCYLPPSADARANPVHLAHTATDATTEHAPITQLSFYAADGSSPLPTRKVATLKHRHLIFIEPDLLELGTEVTVAHELIHLSDRVRGRPRRHHCHGYDAIAADEAAITERDPELLRQLLRDETARRESVLRTSRPIRYLYVCPNCSKEYPRVKRYARPVSCGSCDRAYNPHFILELRDDALHQQPEPMPVM
jgi:predicted SprT family Zn-dependent metalloprotease